MTKADLIDEVSKISSLTNKETENNRQHDLRQHHGCVVGRATRSSFEASGASGSVTGIREGRNPKTGSSVYVPRSGSVSSR